MILNRRTILSLSAVLGRGARKQCHRDVLAIKLKDYFSAVIFDDASMDLNNSNTVHFLLFVGGGFR